MREMLLGPEVEGELAVAQAARTVNSGGREMQHPPQGRCQSDVFREV